MSDLECLLFSRQTDIFSVYISQFIGNLIQTIKNSSVFVYTQFSISCLPQIIVVGKPLCLSALFVGLFNRSETIVRKTFSNHVTRIKVSI